MLEIAPRKGVSRLLDILSNVVTAAVKQVIMFFNRISVIVG